MIAFFTLGFCTNSEEFATVGMVAFCIIMYMWLDNKEEEIEFDDRIKLPSVGDYQKQSYSSVEEKFKSAGFTNIRCVPLNDLKVGLLKKPNRVDSITINGKYVNWSKKYPSDAAIVISYHSH